MTDTFNKDVWASQLVIDHSGGKHHATIIFNLTEELLLFHELKLEQDKNHVMDALEALVETL